jgi:hypothetical protein
MEGRYLYVSAIIFVFSFKKVWASGVCAIILFPKEVCLLDWPLSCSHCVSCIY